MKKTIMAVFSAALCLFLTGCGKTGAAAWSTVFIILGILILALAGLRTYSHYQYQQRAKKRPGRYKKRPLDALTLGLYGAALLAVLLGLLVSCGGETQTPEDTTESTAETTVETTQPPSLYRPAATGITDPANWDIRWEIFSGSRIRRVRSRETSPAM